MSKTVIDEVKMRHITVHGKTYKLPQNPVWHEGPPPEIGWWPTSVNLYKPNVEHLRFFNGEGWSLLSFPNENSYCAGRNAKNDPNAWSIKRVKWTAQWWKGQQ